jgi:hypothetical protein
VKYLLLAVLVCAALPALADTYPLGIGAYGGYDMPVIQDDVGKGPMWAVGVRGNVWHFVHAQLFVRGTSQGDVTKTAEFGDATEDLIFKGGTLTGFGLNVLLAKHDPASVWPYALLGVSTNSLKPGESFKKKETLMGWCFGGGLGINLYDKKIYLDVNTSLLVMPFHDNKASRKNWQSFAGVQYFIPIKVK